MGVQPMKGDTRICDGCGVEMRHMIDTINPMKDGYYCQKCSKVWHIWDEVKKPVFAKHNQNALDELEEKRVIIFGKMKPSNATGVEAPVESDRIAKINKALDELKDKSVKEVK